MVKVILIN